jgi:hypothetical protein
LSPINSISNIKDCLCFKDIGEVKLCSPEFIFLPLNVKIKIIEKDTVVADPIASCFITAQFVPSLPSSCNFQPGGSVPASNPSVRGIASVGEVVMNPARVRVSITFPSVMIRVTS